MESGLADLAEDVVQVGNRHGYLVLLRQLGLGFRVRVRVRVRVSGRRAAAAQPEGTGSAVGSRGGTRREARAVRRCALCAAVRLRGVAVRREAA